MMPSLDGTGTMHAVIQIGNSILMMGDEMGDCKSAETLGFCPVSLYVYVTDADSMFKQAVAAGAGAAVVMPAKEEIREGAKAFFAGFKK